MSEEFTAGGILLKSVTATLAIDTTLNHEPVLIIDNGDSVDRDHRDGRLDHRSAASTTCTYRWAANHVQSGLEG